MYVLRVLVRDMGFILLLIDRKIEVIKNSLSKEAGTRRDDIIIEYKSDERVDQTWFILPFSEELSWGIAAGRRRAKILFLSLERPHTTEKMMHSPIRTPNTYAATFPPYRLGSRKL